MPDLPDEFYTGYLPEAPAGIGRWTKRWVMILLLLALVGAALAATSQQPFAVAFFEFGNERTFEGTLSTEPYPRLLVERPGEHGLAAPTSSYTLVAFGKHGADSEIAGLEGRRIRLRGTLIHRDDQTMIELVSGSIEEIEGPTSSSAVRSASLGQQTLRGEIVDSKCHLGVMKPGEGKPHKACAVLCIRGGIPPVFRIRDDSEEGFRYLLLVGADGRALNKEVLDFVAESIEITGEVERMDDFWILKAEPDSFVRLL